MPMYDVLCGVGHETEQFAWSADRLRPCAWATGSFVCGAAVKLGALRGVAHVHQDTFTGGLVVENWGPTPVRVDSKSDWRREMKARGFVHRDEHVGVPGTDKSPHTQVWTCVDLTDYHDPAVQAEREAAMAAFCGLTVEEYRARLAAPAPVLHAPEAEQREWAIGDYEAPMIPAELADAI